MFPSTGTLEIEFVVHTSQDILDIRFGTGIDDASATTACKGRTLRAEAHEVVFGKHRPLRCEPPFDTGTDCPAGTVV